jgi:membrane-associated protease RseP (regulator of RpoE activity)
MAGGSLAVVANTDGRSSFFRLDAMHLKAIAIVVVTMLIGVFLVASHVKWAATPASIGIGAVVVPVNHTFKIIGVLPGTPAAKSGLQPGMVIQQINGTNITGVPLSICVAMMRGPVGSTVRLKVIDPARSATNIVECSRARIAIPANHGTAIYTTNPVAK